MVNMLLLRRTAAWCHFLKPTHGLRRGLHSYAAPRLLARNCQGDRKAEVSAHTSNEANWERNHESNKWEDIPA